MRRAVARVGWYFAVAAAAATAGCRRDAAAPIAPGILFPDAGTRAPTATASAQGSLVRSELIAEIEPNDAATEAQPVAANAVVAATLLATPTTADAPEAKKGKSAKNKAKISLVDADWYRLPATPAGSIARIELRDAPACAELELYDDTGHTMLRHAKWYKDVHPVLPSLGPAAHASLVRVVCRQKGESAKGEVVGGAYHLAVSTRAVAADEEVEPNDKISPETRALKPGETLQGTLAPLEDVDAYILDLTTFPPNDALMLSIAGVPDVDLEVQLLDPATLHMLLKRRPGKGQGVLLPNLGTARLGQHPQIVLRALAGNQPDAAYALQIGPFLPPGCLRQADCPQLVPSEREPNDESALAFAAPANTNLSGLLDASGDVDWWEINAAPGAVRLRVLPPPGLAISVQLGEDKAALTVQSAQMGQPVIFGGVSVGSSGKLRLAVRAVGDGSSRTDAYRIEVQPLDLHDFENEIGDEAKSATLWSPAQSLLLVARDAADFPAGGWQRHGALLPVADRDAFGLDLRARTQATGLLCVCIGDGQPGLFCAVQDAHGLELTRFSASLAANAVTATPLVVQPGQYKVVVFSDPPRVSLSPYTVQLRESPEAIGLPSSATPVAPPP